MKNILFLLLCAVFVFQSCSKEEKDDGEYLSMLFSETYNSKDSTHHYALFKESLYKQKRSGNISVWEKPCTPPDPIRIDLGYGKFQEFDYDNSHVVLDTDNNIFTFWITSYTTEDNRNTKYKFNIGAYSSSGDFIRNKEISLVDKFGRFKFVEMYNGNILFIYLISSYHVYFVMDKDLNIIEQSQDISLPFDDFVKFVNNERYISYSSSSIVVFDWTKKEITGSDIKAFLAEKYPDEEHRPEFSLSNINLKSNHAEAVLKVTLYNGKIESMNISISYDSGKIIE